MLLWPYYDTVFLSIILYVSYIGLCPELTNPANGSVLTHDNTQDSTATYTCNTGYQLTGNSTRTCQFDGTWSGSSPTCTRM